MRFDEYRQHDATGLAALVGAGEVRPLELLDIALERLAEVNPSLNAVVRLMEEDGRRDANRRPSGPFGGVPFLVKDLLSHCAGHPTSAGSRLLADFVMPRDTELVRRVRASGVSIFGKTNTPEWGLLPVTESEQWGACRNPWNLGRSPGGSSGGSGAAVSAGIVPMAGGGDGGGSIRIPASCCGLFGLKPSRGRTPSGPDKGQLWRGATVEHVLTRSVRDSAAMLDATHGPDPGAPFDIAAPPGPYAADVEADPGRLRIAWTTEPVVDTFVHPDCIAAVDDARALLEDLGHEVVEATPEIDGPVFVRSFLAIMAGEVGADLEEITAMMGRPPKRRELEPSTWALGLLAGAIPALEFANALRTLERVGRVVGSFFQDYDVLLTPTVATPPPPIGTIGSSATEDRLLRVVGAFGSGRILKAVGLIDQAAQTALDFIPWTPLFNASGNPAMSVPLLWNSEGLPTGIHLVGRFGDERTLFRLAGQLERARPWFDRVP